MASANGCRTVSFKVRNSVVEMCASTAVIGWPPMSGNSRAKGEREGVCCSGVVAVTSAEGQGPRMPTIRSDRQKTISAALIIGSTLVMRTRGRVAS